MGELVSHNLEVSLPKLGFNSSGLTEFIMVIKVDKITGQFREVFNGNQS
jgi:hypothetical protein